jgi:hypothetical protein
MKALLFSVSGVEDLITSRYPPDLPAFCRQIFAALRQTA